MDNYNYYSINYSIATQERLNLDIREEVNVWTKIEHDYNQASIHLFDISDTYEANTVLINSNAIKYIENESIAEKLKSFEENKIYVLYPANMSREKQEYCLDLTMGIFLDKSDNPSRDILTESYYDSVKVLGINHSSHPYRSKLLYKPIIILDNMETTYINRYLNPMYYTSDFLYDISNSDFDQIKNDNNLNNEIVRVTNAKELYYYNRNLIERNAKLISAVTFLILILGIMITIFTIKLEFMANGLEISIKKTLGYGLLERNKHLILLPIIIVFFCMIIGLSFVLISGYGDPKYILISFAFMLSSELLLTIIQCRKLDKTNTILLLKGAKQ